LAGPGSRRPVQFTALRPAGNRYRALLLLTGPLLWLAALMGVAFVVVSGNTIGVAIAIAGAAFVIASVLVAVARIRRVARERRT